MISSPMMFFKGFPKVEKLSTQMRLLIGIKETNEEDEATSSVRDPPRVCFCIKSYYMDKIGEWGSRKRRVFGTFILD